MDPLYIEKEIKLFEIQNLYPHEEIDPQNLIKVEHLLRDHDVYTEPISVDQSSGVIIDGHHRFTILKKLGARFIPVILFDYVNDPNILVEPRREILVTKDDVIKKGLSMKPYPYKTTKHLYKHGNTYTELRKLMPKINIKLEELFV